MEVSGPGKSPNSSLSFRYNANNEELEELFHVCDDDPPTPQCDLPSSSLSENASPKRGDKTPSIIDKYFKSIRADKSEKEKVEDVKPSESKTEKEEPRSSSAPKEISSSPMKEYLNRLGKRSTPEVTEVKEVKEGGSETWKIFHDFKFKIAQAVEDMKTKSLEETKDKSVLRENSTSDSEENSAIKDIDQQSVGDTDNQVSSLDSSLQNLSEMTQPITAKAADKDLSLSIETRNSESSDDTHKNLAHSDMVEEDLNESLDVESGVEALEDTLDGFGDINNIPPIIQPSFIETSSNQTPSTPNDFGIPPSQTNLKEKTKDAEPKTYFLNVTMYILISFLVINHILFPDSNLWNGFLLGICFFYLTSSAKDWLLDNFFSDKDYERSIHLMQVKRNSAIPAAYTIPSVKEHRPLKKFEGWINHYRFPDYDPSTYHINKTTTAFMKLKGCNLRLSYTTTKIPKRELWDEKIDKVSFYQHRFYNLTGARVILQPKGLVNRRQWSKKYPICVILNEKEKIQVLEKENTAAEKKNAETVAEKNKKEPLSQHETESTETNTSPEKKKKFVWRKRDKSAAHSEVEPGKEGLRHRLVRKMHRDKKTDSVSTCTEPVLETQGHTLQFEDALAEEIELATGKDEVEEEIDESEMSRIKEFLEEELETSPDGPLDGDWSVHVKHSKDKQTYLYFFARTGRDKHEWYRRLITAISESTPADNSMTENKSASELPPETKDGVDMTFYRSEKESVAFAKNTNKNADISSEGVFISSLSPPLSPESKNYENNFWVYLLKIIQSHEMTFKQTTEAGVMCQIEPTPHEHKQKKKKKCDTKSPSPSCECRVLPAEVTWLNTALARIMFDVMRDPELIKRVQTRIQKKLNTLKLPSFMSPLVVTELSLSGACPLVERVLPPSWDSRGVWLEADLRYDGGAYIALLTQINLMKLKEKNVTLEEHILATHENIVEHDLVGSSFTEKLMRKSKPAVYDSEVEDSAESSSDDETPPIQPVDSGVHLPVAETNTAVVEGGSSKKKFLRMVDKIATNKYFQQVTDYKYVKRAMEGLSNTDIKLHLEIHGLEGRLALNLPPPPHDRLWIGFRTNPQLVLKARPAVGARTLRFAHISNWIEQKLSKEFEKVLVLPNMEDFIIDVMTPTPVRYE